MDVTQPIRYWLDCCSDVWNKWFIQQNNAEDIFIEVEQALLSALVLTPLSNDYEITPSDFFNRLSAVYNLDISDYRSVCRQQKAGNIYCESKKIVMEKGKSLKVVSIDFMGTMLKGTPYAELKFGQSEILLEPVANLTFHFNT